MRKIFEIAALLSTAIIILLSFCSCSLGAPSMFNRFDNNDQSIANARMDNILESIKNNDKDALKSMFSRKAIDEAGNIDSSIDELFTYFQGNFVSYNDWGGPGAEEIMDYGDRKKNLDSTYDVKTSEETYRFAIREYIQDTADPSNVGVYSLYIIKMKDDTDPQYAYWGGYCFAPGIHLNVKNELSTLDS